MRFELYKKARFAIWKAALLIIGGCGLLAAGGRDLIMHFEDFEETFSFRSQLGGSGIILIIFGSLCLWRVPRYFSRLNGLLRTPPDLMRMTIRIVEERDDHSPRYYADLVDGGITITVVLDADCLRHPSIENLLPRLPVFRTTAVNEQIDYARPVKVYGARENGPVVIETDRTVLWPTSDLATTPGRRKRNVSAGLSRRK